MNIDFTARRDTGVRRGYLELATDAFDDGKLVDAESWLTRIGPGRHFFNLYLARVHVAADPRPDLLEHGGRRGAALLVARRSFVAAARALEQVRAWGTLRRLADRLADAGEDRGALACYQALGRNHRSVSRSRLVTIAERRHAAGEYALAHTAWLLTEDVAGSVGFADRVADVDPVIAFDLYSHAGRWEKVATLLPALLALGRVDLLAIAVYNRPAIRPDREVFLAAGRDLAERKLEDAWACFVLADDVPSLVALAEVLASKGLLHAARALVYQMADGPTKAQLCAVVGDLLLADGRLYDAMELFARGGQRDRVRAMAAEFLNEGNTAAARKLFRFIDDEAALLRLDKCEARRRLRRPLQSYSHDDDI